jgi:trigger factor
MQTHSEKLPKSQLSLTFELTSTELQPFVNQAVKTISEVRPVPGFRPGKATYEVLKQHIAEMEIYQAAAEKAVSKVLSDYVKKEEIPLVGQPRVDIEKLAPNNAFLFKAVISILPEVKLPDYEQVKTVEKKSVEVTQEEMDKALSVLRKMHSKETLKNEAAAVGDKGIVDFEIYRDRVLIEDGKYKNFEVVIGDKIVIPGFEQQLIGLKTGDSKEFELEFPKEFGKKDLAGKKATFKVTMKSVYSLETPEANDVFAQSLGQFQSLAELQKQMRNNLEIEKTNREEMRFDEEIFKNLLEKTEMGEIPEILITSEQKRMVEEMKKELVRNKLNWDDFLSHKKKIEEEIETDYKNSAIERLKLIVLLREVGRKEKIEENQKIIEFLREKIGKKVVER